MAIQFCYNSSSEIIRYSPDSNSNYHHQQQQQLKNTVVTPSRTVSLFWDLDNKPPTLAPASLTAARLRDAAAAFGRLTHTVALANRPAVVRLHESLTDRARDRHILDLLERRGAVRPLEPYLCGLCGRKFPTNLNLQKHFKQLHQREQQKRMSRLGQLKGGRAARYAAELGPQQARYRAAYNSLRAVSRAGYVAESVAFGLEKEIRAAGFKIREVSSKARVVEEGLKGGGCLVLVSDDLGMVSVVKWAREIGVKVVVIGSVNGGRGIGKYADTWLRWEDVVVGCGQVAAVAEAKRWLAQELLTRDLVELEDS